MGRSTHFDLNRPRTQVASRSTLTPMKIKRLILVAAIVGGAVAAYMKQQEQQSTGSEDIWKPVDPMRPFGERSDTQ